MKTVEPLSAISERQPATISTDALQAVSGESGADSMHHLAPWHDITGLQTKSRQDMTVLRVHVDFRTLVIHCASGRPSMRTSLANGIRRINHFNRLIGMQEQVMMDAG
jgi:hypothetical protein